MIIFVLELNFTFVSLTRKIKKVYLVTLWKQLSLL